MHDETDRIRLFPLGVVLFPGLPLPLHIFEERYKLMITECLEADEPFGLIYTDGEHMRSIGCTARIVDIVKQHDDGVLDIITRGERKFRLIEAEQPDPFAIGTIAYLEEEDEIDPEAADPGKLLSPVIAQLKRLARITGSRIDLDALRRMEINQVSYLISGLDAFSPEEKQFFLELPSTSQRLIACANSLAGVVHSYDVTSEAASLLPEGRLLHRFN